MSRKSIPKSLRKQIDTMIKDRNAALLSLDEQKIRAYSERYNITLPDNDLDMWAGIHKARCGIRTFPPEIREASAKWLAEHGFHQFGES